MFGSLLDRLTAIVGIRRVRAYETAFAERDGTTQTKGEAARVKALAQALATLEKDAK
jgi:hypothetical protein